MDIESLKKSSEEALEYYKRSQETLLDVVAQMEDKIKKADAIILK